MTDCDDTVLSDELLTIGAFARRCGLSPGALRLYDDVGVLRPARVDPYSGYRYYAIDQQGRARMIRRLREIDVSLGDIAEFFDLPVGRRAALLDGHVAAIRDRAVLARQIADEILADRGDESAASGAGPRLAGAMWATALERVATAAAASSTVSGETGVLAGVHVEVDAVGVTITATDRYRLTTRTVVAAGCATTWSRILDTDAIAGLLPVLRRRGPVRLEPDGDGVRFVDGAQTLRCAGVTGSFPDHRALLAGLPGPITRVITDRRALVRVVEGALTSDSTVNAASVRTADGRLYIGDESTSARIDGPAVALAVDPVVLHPAIEAAVGPDLVLDIAAVDQPIVVRSADPGDVLSLVMPIAA